MLQHVGHWFFNSVVVGTPGRQCRGVPPEEGGAKEWAAWREGGAVLSTTSTRKACLICVFNLAFFPSKLYMLIV